MQLFRYQKEILLTLKILVPVFGIVFLNWSIGTIFLYFFFDLLFVAGETVLKVFAALGSPLMSRIGVFFRFVLGFSVLFLVILIAAGNFFDGGGPGNMEAHFEKEVIYSLCGVYAFEFLFGYLFSGTFKTATAPLVEKRTYYLLLAIFGVMLVFLFLLNAFAKADQVNYVLGISIIVAREGAAYLLAKKEKPASKMI
ncbi:MAG: hypothetical protein HYZ14_06070 [Bacteroidetes bacterium]|nr:hypothetical protein [Bacteroidota bacterium]